MFLNYKNNKNIICNLDDQPMYDKKKKEFLRFFSEEQKIPLLYCIENGYDSRPILYSEIPANRMCIIVNIVFRSGAGYTPVQVWKLAHTKMDDDQFYWCAEALCRGVSLVDKIENIKQYEPDVLHMTVDAICLDIDLTKKISPNMDVNEFFRYGENILNTKRKKMDVKSYL